MKVTVGGESFDFTWQWLVDFIKRILADVFGFIAEEEGWEEEAE